MDFNGKVVLITGASSGIGAATAEYFAELGASLAITARREIKLKNTAENCKKFGAEPFLVLGDISKLADVEHVLKETIKHYGRLDVLVNNAGVLRYGTVENSTQEDYELIMNTNLRAVQYMIKLAIPYLIESKGNIVNVSSVAGMRVFNGIVIYNCSKAALDQLTRCTALELGSKNVRVNSVNPGGVITEMSDKRPDQDQAEFEIQKKEIRKVHPIGRMAEAREVATVIAFFASNLATNITGVTMPVDGGLSLV